MRTLNALFLFVLTLGTAQSATIVVSPGNMNGWSFFAETGTPTGQLVSGPGLTPAGTGSAQMTAPTSGDRMLFGTTSFSGMRLAEVTSLSYSTYRQSGGSALAISLQFDVDTDLGDANGAWMGRLVYEPYYTGSVMDNTWQTWDTLTTGNNWWFSGAPGNASCSIGSPCSLANIISLFPNVGVRVGGITQFKTGGGWTNFDGNVDNFRIATQQFDTTFDFENTGGDVPEPSTYAMMLMAGLAGIAYKKLRT